MRHNTITLPFPLAVIIAIVGLFIVTSPQNASALDSGWESLTVPTEVGVVSVRLIRINLKDTNLQIRSLTDVSGERMNASGPVRSLKSYVDQVSGFAGINGSYFCPSDYSWCAGKEGSYYWMWYDSLKGTYANSYQNQFNPGPVVAFDTQNRLHFFKTAKDWPGQSAFEALNNTKLQALISNGPGLIFENQMTVTPDQLDTKQRTTKSNRSGLGFKGDNIYLVASSSSTVMDLGYAMKAMGMEYAVNLDGGGSTALYYNGQYGVGPGRNLPNSLVFIDNTKPYVPPLATGTSFFAFDKNIRGGFSITSGNVSGDALAEIVAGAESGLAPHIQVLDQKGSALKDFYAFDQNLKNGARVAICDVNADGQDEIITAQGKGGWPLVKIFSGEGAVINNGFYVLDGKFTGGVNLSCGDIDGDQISDIVVAASAGGGPHVLVYDANGNIKTNFMAYDRNFRGGIRVATADADGDGRDEIITGPEIGAPHIQIFQIRRGSITRISPGFYAFSSGYRGGVSVAGVDINGDGSKEIVVGVGNNATPLVRIYSIREKLQKEFYVYPTTFLGGVNVAGGDVDNDGAEELIVTPRSGGSPQVRIIEAANQ